MDNLLKEYIDTSVALQRKYEEMKFGRMMKHEKMAERYKSISEPLKELNNKIPKLQKESTQKSDLSEKYLNPFSFDERKIDRVYGIRKEEKGLYLGAALIEFENDDIILHDDAGPTRYHCTDGLWELLISPKPQNYNESDLEKYADMILRSYVYKHNNDRTSTRRKANRGYKYTHIIKPILDMQLKTVQKPDDDDLEPDDDDLWDTSFDTFGKKRKQYGGSGLHKINTNKPVEYVYWNTVDELLERLCILYGQVKSGNSNPLLSNEIVNIIQELREI